MSLINIFPTNILYKNDLVFSNKVLEYSNKIFNKLPKHEFWEYDTTYLDDNINLKLYNQPWIMDKINSITQEYLNETHQTFITETITHLFLSDIKNGERHCMHSHSQNILSGIFYLDVANNSSPIGFHHPNNLINFNGLKPLSQTKFNTSEFKFTPKSGDILVWESWLYHTVYPNNSTTRKTLVFNVAPKPIQ